MKRILRTILIVWLFAITSVISKAQVVDLPINVDFNDYTGTDISETYPGWTEGKGYPTPSLGAGSWYRGDLLYNSPVATVAVNSASHKEWMISPEFKVTENTCVFFKAAISLDYDYPVESELSSDDEFGVYISEDGGSSFTKIQDFSDSLKYNLKQFHLRLSDYNEKTVRIGFYVSDGQVDNSYAVVHLDDVKIKNLKETDLAVNNFFISNNIEQNKEISLQVEITNEGLKKLTQVPLKINIRGPENFTDLIVLDDEFNFADYKKLSLTNIKLSKVGEYKITVSSDLINDEDVNNNSFSESFQLLPNKSLPLEELDFKYSYDKISFYDGWKEAIGKPDVISYVDSWWASEVYDGKAAFVTSYYQLTAKDWIISPSFNCEENTYLNFKSVVEPLEGSTSMGSDDKLIVYVTSDGGQSWDYIDEINKDNFSTTWENLFYDLSAYKGSVIKVGLFATTGDVYDDQEFNLYINNLNIKNYNAKDIRVDKLMQPNKKAEFGSNENIALQITNIGKEDINEFSVSYTLNNGAEVKEEVSQLIETQESFTYVFNTKADLTSDNNKISIKAYLDDDSESSNNELKDIELTTFSFNPLTEGKYTQSFEDNEDYSSWVIVDGNNDGSTWELYHDGGSYDFDGYYNFRYSSRNTTLQSNEWLISNGFYLKAGVEYKVSFYFSNRAGAFPEKLKLTMGQDQTIASQNIELIDFGEITNNQFEKAEKTLTVSADGYYYFGWNDYGDASSYAVMIDKISVQQKYSTDLAINRLFFPRDIDHTNNILDSLRRAYIEVENQGDVAVTNIPVKLDLNNGEKEISLDFNFSQTLNAGEKIKLILENDDFVFESDKLINAKVYINNSSEEYTANDTLAINNYNHYNYFSSFEYADETESWISVDEDEGGHTWSRENDKIHSHSGNYCYGVKTNKFSGYDQNIDWLITNGVYLDASSCYKIKFWYRNLYSRENLKLYLGDSNDSEDFTNKIFDVVLNDVNNTLYQEADIVLSVEESGIYYLGFLTDREISSRYYIYIDDFSIERIETPTPEFDIAINQVYKNAILKMENANSNVKTWEWTVNGESFNDISEFEYAFADNGTYTIKLEASNQCASETKEKELVVDYTVADDFEYIIDDKKVTFDIDDENISSLYWNFGDENFSNEVSPINIYADYGTYDVTLSVYSVLGSSKIQKSILLDENSTGIDDLLTNQLEIFPNPASLYLNINLEQNGQLEVYNMSGSLVKQVNVKQGHNIIDISNLRTGLYTLRCNKKSAKIIIK